MPRHRVKPSVNVNKAEDGVQDGKDKEHNKKDRVPDVEGLRLVLEPGEL